MKSENLLALSVEELTKKEKESKLILNISIALLIVSPFIIALLLIQKQFMGVFLILVATVFSSILQIINHKKRLNEIKAEFEKRNNNQ